MRCGFLTALSAALGLLALSAGAAAQDAGGERQVRAYLEHGLSRHAALGYASDPTTPDLVAPLRLDHPVLWPVYLVAGQSYRSFAACDDECADLDLEIYAADGALAARDTASDDTPYVQVTPTRSARAYVRIWLYACRAEPCYIAARVTTGGTPAPREGAQRSN